MSNFLSWVVCMQIIGESLPISSSSHVRLLIMLASLIGGSAFFEQPISDFFDHFLHGPMVLIIIIFFRHAWASIFLRLVDVMCVHARRARVRESQRALVRVCLRLIFYVGCASLITAFFYGVIKIVLKNNAVLAHEGTMLAGLCVTAGLLWSVRYVDLFPSTLRSVNPSTGSGRTGLQDTQTPQPFDRLRAYGVQGEGRDRKCEYASRCSKACPKNLKREEQDILETSERTLCFNEARRIELNKRQAQGEHTECVCDSCDYEPLCKKTICPCLPVDGPGGSEKNEKELKSECEYASNCSKACTKKISHREKQNHTSYSKTSAQSPVRLICPSKFVERSRELAVPFKAMQGEEWVEGLRGAEKKITSLKTYIILGLVQGLALLPGISRFASTYVAARWLGFPTRRAFQVCFLLELPIVVAAFLVLGVGGAYKQHGWAVVSEPTVMMTIIGATAVGYGALWTAWWLAERRLLWLFSVYLLLPILTVLYLIFQ